MPKLWGILSRKHSGPQTTHCRCFSTTLQLMGNFNGKYLRNETFGKGYWKLQTVYRNIPNFHELWSTNGLKYYRHFYPVSVFCLLPAIVQTASGITWRRTANLNETALGLKDFNLVMASRRVALSGNVSLISTFFS